MASPVTNGLDAIRETMVSATSASVTFRCIHSPGRPACPLVGLTSGGGGGLVGAAVLTLRRGGRQVAGQARRTGLDRCRIAEHHLPAPGLDGLVGHDDEEVDHR